MDRPTYWERVARLDNRPEWRRRFAEASLRRQQKVDEERNKKERQSESPPIPEGGA